MTRRPIPRETEFKVLYGSAFVCAVCQAGGVQIHHIDGNNSNNSEDNLIVLCANHHGEAHTTRKLAKNLDASTLKRAKEEWASSVRERRTAAATLEGQLASHNADSFLAVGVTWGYINHARVAQLVRPNLLLGDDREFFEFCRQRGLVDMRGILLNAKPIGSGESFMRSTVYDRYEFSDSHRVHKLYSMFVDQISKASQPVHLDQRHWNKTAVRTLVKAGSFIYAERGFYFKTVSETKHNQHRRCRTFARKVSAEFFVDTKDMFGTTSITSSFAGHQHCAALVQVKSVNQNADGSTLLSCTPIALGVGFRSGQIIVPSSEEAE